MPASPIIYWFRNDLRLHDNAGFAQACSDADAVLPVYVFDPASFDPLPELNVPKAGRFRTRFLLESLADLRNRLRAKGGDLVIRTGKPADVLADLSREYGATAVYAGQEATGEEVGLEADVRSRLQPTGASLRLFWMLSLYHPDDMIWAVPDLPDAYRDFRKGCEKQATVRAEVPEPERVSLPDGVDAGNLPTLTDLGFDDAAPDPRAAIRHVGGETAALDRLDAYFWNRDQLKNYKYTRNNLLGEDYSSKFSAWLAYGCLSPRRIYWQVKQYERDRTKNVSTYWLVFELIWRDYFRFQALKQGSLIFRAAGPRRVDTGRWTKDYARFERWASGQTGIPFVDANMRELNATGYQSNRGRQNVASHLLNDLGVWWPWGAAYLESLLIDYDPASNWGNWNLVAKNGADPRNDRYFNVYTQAIRYDPNGEYVRLWCPELSSVPADKIHLVANLTADEQAGYGVQLGRDYPLPLFDPNQWTRRKKAVKS